MKCESIQFDLPLYPDSNLSGEERSRVDGHLEECPGCRQKLTDFQELRQSLRVFERPEIPAGVTNSIKHAVAAEIHANSRRQGSALHIWLNTWLMPSGAGAFASVLVAFLVLWTLHSASNGIAQKPSIAKSADSRLLANANPNRGNSDLDITALSLAQERSLVGGESPSINPNGALVALTRSLVRGEMKDDEVVVVADVFGNGLAQISEVVEPSHDQRAVAELEQALRSDPAFAPFVPANLDGRSDSVRVVLKIQSVDVKTNLKPKRK
jgi:Putative zinc-finger